MSLFPQNMFDKSESGSLNVNSIAAKITFFQEQLHLLHWNTSSYAEHKALGSLYEYVQGFKDDLIEKVMGYTGVKPSGYTVDALRMVPADSIITQMLEYACDLKSYGEMNKYHDVCNLADSFSGEIAKTKYLLTLS